MKYEVFVNGEIDTSTNSEVAAVTAFKKCVDNMNMETTSGKFFAEFRSNETKEFVRVTMESGKL